MMRTDNQSDDRHFLFSVVMPVYNVVEYLEEAIDSLIGQSVGFEENIQLILVNDGSTDDSGIICRRYEDLYPDNITYVFQNNAGVSCARNSGMKYICGTYVNFMDSDDVWDRDAFEHARLFFAEHSDVGIATARMVYLNVPGSWHHLDYMFTHTRAIDIHRNYTCPVYSAAKTFIRADLMEDIRYDERVQIAEDALYINKLIIKHGKLGIIREARYNYRKRTDKSSALDNATVNVSYYLDTPKYVYLGLAEYSRELFGEVIPYIQYLLITDLQWRIRSRQQVDMLPAEDQDRYYSLLTECLQEVSDGIILRQRRMSSAYKAYALRMKYGDESLIPEATKHQQAADLPLYIYRISADNDYVTVTGRAFEKYIGSDYMFIAKDNKGNQYDCEYIRNSAYDVTGISPDFKLEGYTYNFHLPAISGRKYSFWLISGSGYRRKLTVQNVRYSRFTDYENTFFSSNGHIFKLIEDRLCVYDYSIRTYAASARRYSDTLHEALQNEAQKKDSHDADTDLLSLRNRILLKKSLPGKPAVVIETDSGSTDFSMKLFRSLSHSSNMKKYRIYIALDSDQYSEAAKAGDRGILLRGSDEHKIMHGVASAVIAADDKGRYTEPFGPDLIYYRDLLDYRYIILKKDTGGSDNTQLRDGLRTDHILTYSDEADMSRICEELGSLL